MTQKKTMGRRKIEMKRIEERKSRQVTFTKRRHGVFKKASELCVLAGAEIAILVQSPGNHVYAFGHPHVDSVIDTFLGNNVSNSTKNSALMHEECNDKYLEIAKVSEAEKNKLDNAKEIGESWWEKSFEDLEIDQLENYIESMEKLKNNVIKRADELRNLVMSPSLNTNTNASNGDVQNLITCYSLDMNTNASNVNGQNLVTSYSWDTNTNAGNVDGLNMVTCYSLDTNTDASNVEGLLDEQVVLPDLDDQVISPDSDAFLPYDVGVSNADLMLLQGFHNSVGFNNYSFGNGELVLHDQGDNGCQVSSDYGTFGVPDVNHL